MIKTTVEALNDVGFLCVEFKGISMLPLFKEGRDKVLIYKVDIPLKKGDIVLYKRESGLLVLHRIYAINGQELVLLGDNHLRVERGVNKSQVLGICKGYYKYDKLIDFENSMKYKFYKNFYGLNRLPRVFYKAYKKIFK